MAGVVLNPGRSADFIYYGLSGNTAILWSASGAMTGCIYAPNAELTLGGSGILGAGVVRSVRLVSNFQVHYDQALRRSGPVTW